MRWLYKTVRLAFQYPIKTIITVGIFIIAPLKGEIHFDINANLIWLILILLAACFLNFIFKPKPLRRG